MPFSRKRDLVNPQSLWLAFLCNWAASLCRVKHASNNRWGTLAWDRAGCKQGAITQQGSVFFCETDQSCYLLKRAGLILDFRDQWDILHMSIRKRSHKRFEIEIEKGRTDQQKNLEMILQSVNTQNTTQSGFFTANAISWAHTNVWFISFQSQLRIERSLLVQFFTPFFHEEMPGSDKAAAIAVFRSSCLSRLGIWCWYLYWNFEEKNNICQWIRRCLF